MSGVSVEDRGGARWITLDRPERLNSLTFDSYVELGEFFVAIEKPVVVAVGIAGVGAGHALLVVGEAIAVAIGGSGDRTWHQRISG